MKDEYKPIIGLEIHVELKTKSKMFCACSADYFGHKPNTHCCPICLGLPGALPVPNKTAIEWCLMVGLALNCQICSTSKFDRKNYFYPDLPKGYQISQYDEPFAINGSLKLKIKNEKLKITQEKIIRIRRVHMEEDTGKLIHGNVEGEETSLIDFNRSGVPLVEIVTEPDIESAEEAKLFLQKLQQIVRYLNVSNADMEKGEMRLEPNISVKQSYPNGEQTEAEESLPPYKVEVKNINSFRFAEKAINYDIQRQIELLKRGETPIQETRGWNESKQKTVAQRIKEEANDYRYFPEPDIPPMSWTETQILKLKSLITELPDQKLSRFIHDYTLSQDDAEILTRERTMAQYFEEAVKVGKQQNISPKQIANYIINRKPKIEEVLPAQISQNIISSAKFDDINEEELQQAVSQVLAENKQAVADYKKGKEQALMFLVGQVMKKVKVKINSERVKKTLLTDLAK